jgi:hypothetical protein
MALDVAGGPNKADLWSRVGRAIGFKWLNRAHSARS